MSALLLAIALVGAATAAAEETASSSEMAASAALQSDPLFVDAKRLFGDLEFEQAAFRFEQLGLRTELPRSDRAVVLMWLGTSQAKAGDLDSASRSYELALSFDLDATPPVAVSPKVVRLVEAIRTKVAAERKNESNPPSPAPRSDEGDARREAEGGNRPTNSPSDDDTGGAPSEDRRDPAGASAEAGTEATPADAPGAGLPISPLVLGASAAAGVALLAAIGLGTVGAIDIGTALDPKTTQVDALERYSRGVALSVTAGASVVVMGIALTVLSVTLLDEQE